MKTCVQLISPVYLRMCRGVLLLRYLFCTHFHSISLPLSFFLLDVNFFSYLYTENRRTLTKARRPQKNPLFISGGDGFYTPPRVISYIYIISRRGGERRRVRGYFFFFLLHLKFPFFFLCVRVIQIARLYIMITTILLSRATHLSDHHIIINIYLAAACIIIMIICNVCVPSSSRTHMFSYLILRRF